MTDSHIACALTRDALQASRQALLPGLAAAATRIEPGEDSYRFEFAAADGILDVIARTIDGERRCCPFLSFDLRIEPDGGVISLRVAGPPGTGAFLRALLNP